MSPLYCFQFFVYTLCIHIFTMLSYVIYYSDIFSARFRYDLLPEYDYIIVGAGTAGSVIAHRLATETNHTFIVLEAGSKSHFLLEIPIVGPAIHGSLFDWMFETVPQENACFAMENKICKLTQGKIVGGSSKLNNMLHVRGNISHYVDWFDKKYTKEYIKQQFEFVENNIIHLDNIKYESDFSESVLNAAKELGYNYLSTEFGLGFSKSKLSQKNGKRWSSSDNLDLSYVVTNAVVEKIIIVDGEATGVNFILGDKKNTVRARKSVILSAGAFNTPKILQLSGIGPTKLLNSLNIPIVQDLPVGENLQDHIGTGLDLVVMDKHPKISANDILNPINLVLYFLHGHGPLTTPGTEVVGFVSTKNGSVPDLQFMVLPTGISSDRGTHLKKILGIKDNVWHKYFVNTFDKYAASMVPVILHPKSKGTVFINTINPKDPPLIDPKYLSHPEDREILINGLKIVSKFMKTKSMKNIETYLNPLVFPGCENHPTFSDLYWECYIKHLTLTIYHPVGTCSMGLPGKGVVDTNFKVFGLNKLYVADASVLPTLPSGNINAAVAMMASAFFDNSIKRQSSKPKVSSKNSNMYEYLFKMCIVNTKE